METQPRKCLTCGKPVKGRSDKKFCDDYCRNAFNNRSHGSNSGIIHQINMALKRNRQILNLVLPAEQETVKIPEARLVAMGFDFRWTTHQFTNSKGQLYYFCYDHGYLPIENYMYLIVRTKKLH